MTYTVKNGTWCKDNEKEYYSTTKTGLKAALKAGEISAGTKVVIHDPKYHAGQLIQSLNPECPEGCFVPDGSAIDPVYEELIAVVGPNLPDMRECVLVMAGQNEHITTHAHDVFAAGEFKDDCAVEHSHIITVNDPGHKHVINVNDPGHGHSVTDPGHKHIIDISDPGHNHGITDPGHTHDVIVTTDAKVLQTPGSGHNCAFDAFTSNMNIGGIYATGTAISNTTGVSVDSNTTGITASANNGATGVSVDSNTTGITAAADNSTAGITASCSTTGDNVTRTKQFGVYYYIAF